MRRSNGRGLETGAWRTAPALDPTPLAVGVVLAAAALFALWPASPRAPIQATNAVREALAEERAGVARVLAPRPLSPCNSRTDEG